MNKKHLKLLLPIFLIFILSFQLVFAATGGFFQNNPILKSLFDMLGQTVPWPPYNATPGIPIASQPNVPVFLIILVWLALFTVLYVLANNIELFSKSPHKGAIMWFCIAFAGIAVSGTSFVNNIAALVDWTQGLLAIFGFIVITILLIGVLWSGSRLGGGMISPTRWGNAQDQTKAIENEREKKAAKQELENEEKLYKREEEGIKKAEELLKKNVLSIRNETDRIRHLLKVVEELQKVGTSGAAVPLRQSFDRQAGAVIAQLRATANYTNQERDLQTNLRQITATNLNNVLASKVRLLQNSKRAENQRYAAIVGPTAAQLATHNTNIATLDRRITQVRGFQAQIVQLSQKKTEMGNKIQSTLNNLNNNSPKIAQAIEAAIRDVHSGNYPNAIVILNQAIEQFTQEVTMLSEVESLLRESGQITQNEATLVTGINAV